MAPTVLHVAPHPDDEAVGAPGALLHLLDRRWNVVSLIASLGFEGQQDRRRAEAEEASTRAGFEPVFFDPPLNLDLDGDLALATQLLAAELPALVERHGASIIVSPSPHDVHHGHEAVGRAVQRAMAALPPSTRWWMWGVWGELPAPNVFYGYDQRVLDRALHILDAYEGELERNDYRPFLSGRAAANAVIGAERVFGFGSPAVTTMPYADLLTEVRLIDGRFLASEPHQLDQGPEPTALYDFDLTPWLEAPSVRELIGPVREVREDLG
ncbi:MAG TPA: PIG-L family deacetylase [Acidimicrobiales bacterium]|nr:PIG-L family deacetylase [Acidimicrobiales bacterium]